MCPDVCFKKQRLWRVKQSDLFQIPDRAFVVLVEPCRGNFDSLISLLLLPFQAVYLIAGG
jgi:hypothetical protein